MVRANDQGREVRKKSTPASLSVCPGRLSPWTRATGLVNRIRSDLGTYRRPITVVWCEDEPTICEIFSVALTFSGFGTEERGHPGDQLLFTPCGDEALALVEKHSAEVFVTDECHPTGPGGLALLGRLAPRPDLVLGYVTGAAIEDDARRLVDFCSSKPPNLHDFLREFGGLLARVRARTYRPLRIVPAP